MPFGRLCILILAVFTAYVIYLNFAYTAHTNAFIYVLVVIPAFAVVYFLAYKIRFLPAAFAVTVFVGAFLAKGVFAALVDTQPVSDFNTFYSCAVDLLNGNKSFGQGLYFRTWAYQTGPIIYYSFIMKLFGTGLLPLKLINCFFMAGSNMFVYLIARKVSNDYTARFVALLYLIYPEPYFLAAVLTNQHFASCMFLAAIYVLLVERMNIIARGAVAGVLIALGNAVRPLGIIIAAAVFIWGLIEAIRFRKLAKVAVAALVLAVYLLGSFGISASVKYSGINPEGLANNFPLWKFVVGLNQQSKGQFNYEDQNKLLYIEDFGKRNEDAKKVIKERIEVGPHELLQLMGEKVNIMWAEFDTLRWEFYQSTDGSLKPSKDFEKIEPVVLGLEKIFYMAVFILLLAGLCMSVANGKIRTEIVLLSILLLCFFGAHLLIEIQVRYRYFALLIIFILAAKGSEILFAGLKNYRRQYDNL